jgi:HK97 family phage major capsid protein
MTISEQIAEILKKRGGYVTTLEELRARTEKDNRVFTDEERTAFDQTTKGVKDLDEQTERLREMETIIARQATPPEGVRITGGTRNVPAGIGFTRSVRAIMLAQGNLMQASEIARSMFGDTPEVALAIRSQMYGLMHQRAAVPAAMTTDPAWAGALVAQQTLAGEFIALVRPQTITGRLNLRRVPFNVKIPREVTPLGTAGWVGEGKPKPVGKGAYDMITAPMTKLALITLQSEELARSSDPNSETLLRDGLSQSIALEKNKHFISAAAPVAGISPGGILNGLPGGQTFASSGNTPADVQADITHAISLLNEGLGATNPAWIMNTLTKTWLAGLQNGAQTGTQFPTVAGGTLAGYPIVDSTTQPAGTIILLDQALVILAEEDAIEIDISREASVQMDSAPADPAVGLVSLWQNNLIGLRGEQFTYWMRARDSAVVTITGVGYTTWPPAGLMRAPQAPQAPQGSHAPAEGARR